MLVSPHDESVPGRFLAHAENDPSRHLFTFIGNDGNEEATLTARQLRERAAGVALFLRREVGLRRGDRVLLAYPPSLDFVVGLLGSMFAGLVPVPVPPPDPTDLPHHLPRFSAMAASSGARAVLSNRQYLRAKTLAGARDKIVGLLGRDRSRWPELPWHATDTMRPSTAAVPFETPPMSDVAALQYTSGSTAFPRGVMITHGNLVHQLSCNAAELGIDSSSRAVFWVPHFHDFGLISGIMSALHGNVFMALMSPLTFLRRPDLWIDQLSKQRATHTAAPNFAYDLVVRKTTDAQRRRWNLRSMRVAMSAAEPVRDEVVRAFCDAFAVSGFRPEAFCPAYGLAEHTVGVSVGGRGRLRVDRQALEHDRVLRPIQDEGPSSRVLVGCGRPSQGVTLRVVDPTTRREVSAGAVGELWVDSPSKAAGYWGLEEDTRATFRARLADPADETEYLRTGDLGALIDGEVYIVGRRKDLIILRGRNVYPQDLEDSIRDAHSKSRPGGVAAFSVERDDGAGEQLVVFVETREASPSRALAEEIAAAVRRKLAEDHQLVCETVVVGAAGLVLKTTSGKVRRSACRQAYLSGETASGSHAIHERTAREAPVPRPQPAEPTSDPRLENLAPSYEALILNAARYLTRDSGEKRPSGIAARGVLHVLEASELPAHRFFVPGRKLPVLLRHDNRTSADDAAPDARVAALRVLDAEHPTALDRSQLDLVLLTGRCFFHRTAEDFFRFSVSPPEAREAILRAEPHRSEAAWEGVRLGDSYRRFHYHSQTAGRFVATDGSEWFARYRLLDPEERADEGFVDSEGELYPAAGAARRADEVRSPSCLRDEFAARVRERGVEYLLQLQLMPASSDAATNDRLLDSTRPWPDDDAPWRTIARLSLDQVIDDTATLAGLELSPFNAPSDLGVVYAQNERQSASIHHVRTILYEVSARTRLGRALSPGLRALLDRRPARAAAPQRTIAVVGAGASGLTLARELEKQGHTVTVFERDERVGGMCQTRTFDGVTVDLGGHMIFPQVYPTIVELARQLGEELVPDFPDCSIALDGGRVLSKNHTSATRAAKARVAQILQQTGALKPGLRGIDPSLSIPISQWIEHEQLGAIWDWMGSIFVGAGYGYLEDDVPATYLAKSFAHTLDEEGRYQLANGFQRLWEGVAAGLRDVRTRSEVQAAVRDDDGVTLTVRSPNGVSTQRFDRLVIAHSPGAALGWLDASPEERALFGRVRHLPYVSAFLEVEGIPTELRGRWCFVPENTSSAARRGHVLSFVQMDPARPVVGLIAYAPPPGVDPETLFAEDFARLGARVKRVHHRQQWSYFPHFSAEDLRGGALEQLETMQGARHTWHASTLLSFELTECAAAYAREVATRIDRNLQGASESAPAFVRAPKGDAAAFDAFRATVDSERTRVVAYLQRVMAEEMELRTLPDPDTELSVLGVDSLRAAGIYQRVLTDSGLDLPPTLLSEAKNLRSLAERVVAQVVAPATTGAEDVQVDGDAETLGLLEQLQQGVTGLA